MKVGRIGEVAGQLRCRRDIGLALCWFDITPAFIACVEKCLVLEDRTANRSPELVLPQNSGTVGSYDAGHGVLGNISKGIAGVKNIVAGKFPCRTVELIGARLGNNADYATRGTAVLDLVVMA